MSLNSGTLVRDQFGSWYDIVSKGVIFRVFSKNALRIELQIFKTAIKSDACMTIVMTQSQPLTWTASIPLTELTKSGFTNVVYYGYRVWGPNWPFDASWKKGGLTGFITDCDNDGNRFNPNKLLIDPWTREISHDPEQRLSYIDPNENVESYYSGDQNRHRDTAPFAPKSMLILEDAASETGIKPKRALKDDIIYEVHLRGLTAQDMSIPAELRGTYKGAALKASYLRDLGITAVEFLPVQQFASEQNDDTDLRGDNYWGYMTLGYFAPNRRYASDRSPGGPTREFKAMVRSFHEAGIKVFLDVVFNHTGEGLLYRTTEDNDSREDDFRQDPYSACILSFRGLDNATFYTLRSSYVDNGKTNLRYQDNSACGGSLNVASEPVRNFICDALKYWSTEMGVDGFRFDLAPVLGNKCSRDRFEFDNVDSNNILNRLVSELPLRSPVSNEGVDLIAEPWATGSGQTYQLGHFPDGWSEWNDVYRSTLRQFENKLHVMSLAPHRIANALAGSDQQFWYGSTRKEPHPFNSINYVSSHDGYTLRDLFSCTNFDFSWDHNSSRCEQRKAVRNMISLLFTSAGVPMFCGGDELFKSQDCVHNAVALDNKLTHIDWHIINKFLESPIVTTGSSLPDDVMMHTFFKGMIAFRKKHLSICPENYFTGLDISGKGIKDISWYRPDGYEFAGNDWEHGFFIAMRIDNQQFRSHGDTGSVYIAYNWNDQFTDITLPVNISDMQWFRYADTAPWFECASNIDEHLTPLDHHYGMHARSVLVLIEK